MRNSLVYLLFVLTLVSCKQESKNNYSLEVELSENYSGYLYLRTGVFGDKIDSVLVQEQKVVFNGRVTNPELANFATDGISACDKSFYIEPGIMHTKISILEREINGLKLDWIQIDTLYGTPLATAQNNFLNFVHEHKGKAGWNTRLFSKLETICEQFKDTRYTGDLLAEFRFDSTLTSVQWKYLFEKLKPEFQNPDMMRRIKAMAYPDSFVEVGRPIFDFELPNSENKWVGTSQFRGDYLLIDFWASWCTPCRESFPEVRQLYVDFHDKNFSILSVSLDERITNWQKASQKEKLPWENVVDTLAFEGIVAEKYQLFGIPSYVLVDSDGIVMGRFETIDQVRKSVQNIFGKTND